MNIEELRTFFRAREEKPQTSFKTWQDVFEQFKKFDPNDGCFYMLTTDKSTVNEARSRFLTHAEAMKVIMDELEKSKLRVA